MEDLVNLETYAVFWYERSVIQ